MTLVNVKQISLFDTIH